MSASLKKFDALDYIIAGEGLFIILLFGVTLIEIWGFLSWISSGVILVMFAGVLFPTVGSNGKAIELSVRATG